MKTRHDLPVMSVKELAAELGEPQTKLYRHVRQLEAAGLIKVASTRMVSGILEQRYQASQQDLIFGRGFIREHADESMGLMQTLLDRFRDGFFAAFQANRQSAGDETAVEPYRKPMLLFSDVKISPAKAAELRDKLEEITNDLSDKKTEDPNGIPVNLLIGCFVPGESGRCRADQRQLTDDGQVLGVVVSGHPQLRPARASPDRGDQRLVRQPVGEPDDAIALSADGRRGRREGFPAGQDKPFDVGRQLDERETDARFRRAQGYVGAVLRGRVHRVGIGSVDGDRGDAAVARVGDVLHGEPPGVSVNRAAREYSAGSGDAADGNRNRKGWLLRCRSRRRGQRCCRGDGSAEAQATDRCHGAPQPDAPSPLDDAVNRSGRRFDHLRQPGRTLHCGLRRIT